MSVSAFHVFDITYDIAFSFVVIGRTDEEREPQSSRFVEICIILAVTIGK